MKKNILIAIASLFAILVIGLIIINVKIAYTNKADQRYIRDELAQIKRAGEPVTSSDLGKINIPKNKNAAYVYIEAFKYLPKYEPKSNETDWTIINSLNKSLNHNPKVIQNAREQVKAADKALSFLTKATLLPDCKFPRDYSNAIEVKFPEYAKIRTLSRYASAKAILAALDGNSNTAVRLSIETCKINEALKEEPTLISQLGRYAILSIGCKSIYRINQELSLSNKQMQSIYDELNKIDVRNLKDTYAEDRAMGLWCFDHPAELVNIDGKQSVITNSKETKDLFIKDKAFFLRRMREIINASDIPYYKRLPLGIDKRFEEIPRSPQHIISVIALPPFFGLVKKLDQAKATINGTKTMLLLKMYKNTYREYPTSLIQLSQKLGKKIDNDSFSGKPFIYKRNSKGFILYSIGENLKDDGGVTREDLNAKDNGSDNYDLVWQF